MVPFICSQFMILCAKDTWSQVCMRVFARACVCAAAAILACLFDQPIKALRRGQIARTDTLSLLCFTLSVSFLLTHISLATNTL